MWRGCVDAVIVVADVVLIWGHGQVKRIISVHNIAEVVASGSSKIGIVSIFFGLGEADARIVEWPRRLGEVHRGAAHDAW